MALTPHGLLASLGLLFAVASLIPWPYSHHLLAVAVLLLAIAALVA